MADEAAFLAKIIAEPKEDTHRLVFADWLDENGQPERAEFIRLQIELARTPECDLCRTLGKRGASSRYIVGCACETKRHRERELLDLHELDWYGSSLAVIVADAIADAVLTGEPPRAPVFRRGFVDEVTCTVSDWLHFGDAIRAAHPVTKVAWAPHGRLTWGTYQNRDGTTTTIHTNAEFKAWAEAYWPGIAFELPSGTISPPGNP